MVSVWCVYDFTFGILLNSLSRSPFTRPFHSPTQTQAEPLLSHDSGLEDPCSANYTFYLCVYFFLPFCLLCNLIFSQISQIFGEQYKKSYSPKETEWISSVILWFWQNYVMKMAGDYYTLAIHRISAWKGSGWRPSFYIWRNQFTKVSHPSQISLFQVVEGWDSHSKFLVLKFCFLLGCAISATRH